MTPKDPLADVQWPKATATPSQDCSQAIRGVCTEGLCARRGMSPLVRGLVTLGLSVLLFSYYTWYAVTEHPPSAVVSTALYGAVGWIGAQALLVFVTLVRPPGRRGSRTARLALLLGTPLAFVGYLALQSTEHFSLERFSHGAPASHALGCGAFALLLGALVAGGAMVAWRRTDPYDPGLSGATIGLVGGLGSGLGMSVACPSHELLHACFSHGLIVFALAIAGFGVGRRLLSP